MSGLTKEKTTLLQSDTLKPYAFELKQIYNAKGGLAVIENLPFEVKRVYYLYDTPRDATRGRHAHRELEQVLVAISGSFVVTLTDEEGACYVYLMDRKDYGLYVPPMYWRVIGNFSPGAICLALASTNYDESDYIRTYAEFAKNLT